MATKTAKGKKGKAKEPAKAPKAAKKGKAAAPADDEEVSEIAAEGGADDGELDGDDADFDDDEEEKPAPKAAAAAAKPAPKKGAPQKQAEGETVAQVPARRLTPEAKAKVNEMVKKGMSLGDALKAAASWETFVAPVKEEAPRIGAGRPFEGGPRPPRPRREESDEEGGSSSGGDDETEESIGATSDDE
jgi:hypothetical protein